MPLSVCRRTLAHASNSEQPYHRAPGIPPVDKRIINLIAREHEQDRLHPGDLVHVYLDPTTGQIALRITEGEPPPPKGGLLKRLLGRAA